MVSLWPLSVNRVQRMMLYTVYRMYATVACVKRVSYCCCQGRQHSCRIFGKVTAEVVVSGSHTKHFCGTRVPESMECRIASCSHRHPCVSALRCLGKEPFPFETELCRGSSMACLCGRWLSVSILGVSRSSRSGKRSLSVRT